MIHIMHDIETMSTSPNAAIISIGAVKFDEEKLYDTFYVNIDLRSCQQFGLEMDADTVLWWMKQTDVAREKLQTNVTPLDVALIAYSEWCRENTDPDYIMVWGNGAEFDNVIVSNACSAVGIPTPWKFWNSRCYRTVKSLYPEIKISRVGEHHCALDDAKSQAKHLIDICGITGLPLL